MAPTAAASSIRRPTATVLVVEDEAIIAEELGEFMQDLGYAALGPARSAAEALQTLQRRNVDIVLMDISLRGRIDGINATVEIEDRFGIPVIYVSGCSSPEIEASVVCSQPFGFVAKPYDSRHLARVIARALQGPGEMSGAPLAH